MQASPDEIKVEYFEEVSQLKSSWQALLEKSGQAAVFQTIEWHRAWLKSFSTAGRALFIQVTVGGIPTLLFPGFIRPVRQFGLSQNELSMIGSHNFASDSLSLIGDSHHREARLAIIEAIFSRDDWDFLRINNLSSNSNFIREFCEVGAEKDTECFTGFASESPIIDLTNKTATDRIFSSRNSNRRLTRLISKMEGRYVQYKEPEEIYRRLPGLFAMHTRQWNLRQHQQFRDIEQQNFFKALANEFSQKNIIRFNAIELKGQAIALHFGFEYGGRFTWYKPTYEHSYAKFSPGDVLLLLEIQNCLSRKIEIFDFGAGGEKYKHKFATSTPLLRQLEAFRSKPAKTYSFLRSLKRKVLSLSKLTDKRFYS